MRSCSQCFKTRMLSLTRRLKSSIDWMETLRGKQRWMLNWVRWSNLARRKLSKLTSNCFQQSKKSINRFLATLFSSMKRKFKRRIRRLRSSSMSLSNTMSRRNKRSTQHEKSWSSSTKFKRNRQFSSTICLKANTHRAKGSRQSPPKNDQSPSTCTHINTSLSPLKKRRKTPWDSNFSTRRMTLKLLKSFQSPLLLGRWRITPSFKKWLISFRLKFENTSARKRIEKG